MWSVELKAATPFVPKVSERIGDAKASPEISRVLGNIDMDLVDLDDLQIAATVSSTAFVLPNNVLRSDGKPCHWRNTFTLCSADAYENLSPEIRLARSQASLVVQLCCRKLLPSRETETEIGGGLSVADAELPMHKAVVDETPLHMESCVEAYDVPEGEGSNRCDDKEELEEEKGKGQPEQYGEPFVCMQCYSPLESVLEDSDELASITETILRMLENDPSVNPTTDDLRTLSSYHPPCTAIQAPSPQHRFVFMPEYVAMCQQYGPQWQLVQPVHFSVPYELECDRRPHDGANEMQERLDRVAPLIEQYYGELLSTEHLDKDLMALERAMGDLAQSLDTDGKLAEEADCSPQLIESLRHLRAKEEIFKVLQHHMSRELAVSQKCTKLSDAERAAYFEQVLAGARAEAAAMTRRKRTPDKSRPDVIEEEPEARLEARRKKHLAAIERTSRRIDLLTRISREWTLTADENQNKSEADEGGSSSPGSTHFPPAGGSTKCVRYTIAVLTIDLVRGIDVPGRGSNTPPHDSKTEGLQKDLFPDQPGDKGEGGDEGGITRYRPHIMECTPLTENVFRMGLKFRTNFKGDNGLVSFLLEANVANRSSTGQIMVDERVVARLMTKLKPKMYAGRKHAVVLPHARGENPSLLHSFMGTAFFTPTDIGMGVPRTVTLDFELECLDRARGVMRLNTFSVEVPWRRLAQEAGIVDPVNGMEPCKDLLHTMDTDRTVSNCRTTVNFKMNDTEDWYCTAVAVPTVMVLSVPVLPLLRMDHMAECVANRMFERLNLQDGAGNPDLGAGSSANSSPFSLVEEEVRRRTKIFVIHGLVVDYVFGPRMFVEDNAVYRNPRMLKELVSQNRCAVKVGSKSAIDDELLSVLFPAAPNVQ